MLKKRTNQGKVEVISCYNSRQSDTKSVAKNLQRNIIDMRFVARQKDDRMLLFRSLLCNRTQSQNFLARNVNTFKYTVSAQDPMQWNGYLIDLDDTLVSKAVYKCNMRP